MKKDLEKLFEGKKAILFDFDGTIGDSMGMWNIVDGVLIKHISGKTPTNNIGRERSLFLSENNSGNIYMKYAQYLRDKYESNYSAEEVDYLRGEIALQYMTNSLDFKPNADKFLNLLKGKGFKLCLATLSTQWAIDVYTEHNNNFISKANLKHIFGDNILTKESVSKKKPDPEIYLKAMECLNVTPKDCLVFEDSLEGITAAKNAGIDTIAVYESHNDVDRDKIDNLTDAKIVDYNEVIEVLKDFTM